MLPSKLLISLKSADELLSVAHFAFPWIDLKNPSAGSIGCPDADVASKFLESANRCLDRKRCQVSIALGELVDESWRRIGSIASNFDFGKIALSGCKNRSDWTTKVGRLAGEIGGGDRLILVHYADNSRADSPDWETTLDAAASIRSQFILIDTFDKSAGRLWNWYSPDAIRDLAIAADGKGIGLSIAGSLQLDDLAWARGLGAKIVGVRGAACQDGSRVDALCHDRLTTLSEIFSNQAVTS